MKKYFKKFKLVLFVFFLSLVSSHPTYAYNNTWIILKEYDADSVLEVIQDEVPNLKVNAVSFFSNGWTNLVADINNEWIFRFPRSESFMLILEREQILLDRLREYITLPIPNYEYIGLNTAFVAYRKIPGESLSEDIYLTLSIETRQEIANTLALFLSQLHGAISIEEGYQLGYCEYQAPLQLIENSLLGTLPSNDIERIVTESLIYLREHPYDIKQNVFLHNDLHGENFAFDVKLQTVRGVFDFSEAALGHYSVEFGKLFLVHSDLAMRTSDAYASINGVPNAIILSAVDFILRRCTYLLHYREVQNETWISILIKMLEDFVPIWDRLLLEKPSL